MIESSILCSSAWDSDLFQDFVPEFEPTSVFDAIEYIGEFDSKESKPSSCATTPEDLSSASSSDYEFLSFDDLSNILPISDTFVSQILEDENIATGLNEFDISSSSHSPKKSIAPSDRYLSSVSSSSSPTKKKKVKRSPEYLSSSKSWSKMSPDEQLRTLHALSEIVTKHMGIREQMEVIRIIDPTAIISPDDKEFALDSSFLNDSKLRRIKDFVKKNVVLLSKSSNSSSNSLMTSKKTKTQNNTRFHRTKRRPRKTKGSSVNECDLRERKVQEQGKKEEQSGLFVYEKKIKKLNNPSGEDEDVNILE